MVSPVSGRVVSTNGLLSEKPHAVSISPLDDGWLFELAVNDTDVEDADVLPTAEVAHIYANDERHLEQLLSAEMAREEAGDAHRHMDHGQAIRRLSETLGPAEYLKMLRDIYT